MVEWRRNAGEESFRHASADRLLSEFGGNKIVILDEAQRINDIGLRLKLLADADSGELIDNAVNAINQNLRVPQMRYVVSGQRVRPFDPLCRALSVLLF